MKIAVIPARGGSKRISGKNIKTFAGKPLIAYSLAAANASGFQQRDGTATAHTRGSPHTGSEFGYPRRGLETNWTASPER